MTSAADLLVPTLAVGGRFDNAIGLGLGVIALVFLIFVLVFPERF